MEFLLELIFEFFLQAIVEILVELGLHSVAAPFRRDAHPVSAAIGYGFFGAIIGALSLLPFPTHAVSAAGNLRILNLVVTPLAVGIVMMLIGFWRARRGDEVLRIDRFLYGYTFALTFALVRFQFAD